MSSSNKIQIWLLGGIGILSVSMMVYFMFFRKPSSIPAIKNGKSIDSSKPAPEGKADKVTENISKPALSSVKEEVEVEDVDEEEEEEEEADAVSAEQEQLKTKYDDASRLASKYISGQSYEKAVEKLSEALELAPRISTSSKDMIALYNNRSAMYEKLGTFDKSLSDITVVLTMDAVHLKARVRRARIFEAQGKLKQAMEEYVFAGLVQQMKNEPPSNQHKVEAMVKELAQKTSANLCKSLRAAAAASGESLLPSKSHCKNFLESYPSMHVWIPHYQTVERATLVSALEEAAGDADLVRQCTLDLVCFDLLAHKFEDAFTLLNTLPVPDASAAPEEAPMSSTQALCYVAPYDEAQRADPNQMISFQLELVGFHKHLRRDLAGAIDAYNLALRYNPNNIDARMKLSNVYLEVPDLAASMALYDDILTHLEQRSDAQEEVAVVMKAWTLLHRVSNYIVRDDSGVYPAGAIVNAQKDVDEALAVADKVKDTVAGKAAMITGLVRSVHVLMQSKPMVGEPAAEEDMERCKTAIAAAKALSPTNESVLMLEADILNNEGQSDEGMAIIEALQRRPEAIPGDCTYLCLRASMLVNKAMTALQTGEGMQVAQQIFQDASSLYLQAMALEPGAIEVLNQYAQFSSMIGDINNSVRLLKTALGMARTRDDVQDLQQLLLVNEAQLKAIETLKTGRA